MSKSPRKQSGRLTKTAHNPPTDGPNVPESALDQLDGLIIGSLCSGIVAFDRNLKIIQANDAAQKLIDLEEYIDKSLAKGTDSNIWGNWHQLLKSVITTGRRS